MNPRLKPLLLIALIATSLISFHLGATWSQTQTKTRITETGIYAPTLNASEYWLSSTNVTDILAYPEQPASYIIFGRDTNGDGVYDIIYAKNGMTGEIEFNGTDAATVIQSTLNALTSGRTWKERIVIKGNFTISSQITLQSYVILDLRDAKLTLEDGVNDEMFYGSGISNVDILLGELDGNGANQTAGHIIYAYASTDIRIIGGVLKNAYDSGIRLRNCHRVTIRGVYAYDAHIAVYSYPVDITQSTKILIDGCKCNNSVIYVKGCDDVTIKGCHLYGYTYGADILPIDLGVCGKVIVEGNHVNGGKACIYSGNCDYVVIKGNTVTGAWQVGGAWGTGIASGSPGTIIGNVAYGNEGNGINQEVHAGALIGNYVYNNLRGMYIGYAGAGNVLYDVTVEGNIIMNNSDYGIGVDNVQHSVFEGNTIVNNTNYGFYRMGSSDYNNIIGNTFRGNGAVANSFGANDVVKFNTGYVTENSGTVAFSGTSVTFPHGLASTPTGVWASFNSTGYGGWTWTANSTHITITVANPGNYTVYWRAEVN